MRPSAQPTMVHLVFDLLKHADEMRNTFEIAAEVRISRRDAFKSLNYLRSRNAVAWVRQDGVDCWFATPTSDNRVRHIDERVPEVNGRRSRRRTILVTITAQSKE